MALCPALWILDQVQYDGMNVRSRHSRVGGNPQGGVGVVVRIRIMGICRIMTMRCIVLWILDQVQYDGMNVRPRHSRVGGNPQGRGGLVVRIRILRIRWICRIMAMRCIVLWILDQVQYDGEGCWNDGRPAAPLDCGSSPQ